MQAVKQGHPPQESALLRPILGWMRRRSLAAKFLWLGVAGLMTLLCLAAAFAWGGLWWLAWLAAGAVSSLGVLALYRSLALDVQRLEAVMRAAAQGDLSRRCAAHGGDELAQLGQSLDGMVQTLSAMVADIRSNAALVAHAGQHLSHDHAELAQRTDQQASSLTQTAASVQQLFGAVENNAQAALAASEQVNQVRDMASSGAQTMERTVQGMQGLENDARRMGEIIGVIDGIAFQTNILALNAAVEAARAGEQGRGFAVVASEVRTLAGRSSQAAQEIRQLIGASVQQVQSSAAQLRNAGQAIDGMAQRMDSVATHAGEIAHSVQEQGRGVGEIHVAVQQLDDITQRNADMVHASLEHAQALVGRAATLSQAVRMFRLQQGTAEEAVALVERAAALHGRTQGAVYLQTLTDPAQAFYDRDMYVFALDGQGTYQAFGGNPAKVNTRVQDIPGIAGEPLVRAIIAQAERGAGWVEYDITNPTSGAVQTKMSYVQKVGPWYVGCGVYKSLAA